MTSAWGDLERSSWSAGGHSPDCWAEWHHAVAEGPTYDDVVEGGGWIPCGTFTALCSTDTLAFHGAWDEVVNYNYFLYIQLDAELGCTLAVTEPTRLTIVRDLAIPLSSDSHQVQVTEPAGATVTYLGADPADTVTVDLEAGLHTILITIHAYSGDSSDPNHQPPYDGTVTVSWANIEVGAAASTWSVVKGLY